MSSIDPKDKPETDAPEAESLEADSPEENDGGRKGAALDTLDVRGKLSGRRRPPPRRGLEAIVEKGSIRRRGLVVGALPAHAEVLFEEDIDREGLTRSDVHVARVHPALVAVLQSSLVVGDRVLVAELPNGQLFIVEAEPRKTVLARTVVEREKLSQPIVSNANVLWVVVAVANPPMRPGLVDRFFVAAAAGGLIPRLCATKVDLPQEEQSNEWLDYYAKIGFEVARTSAVSHEGLETMRSRLSEGFSVLVGQSGVGKSSIVRAIIPEQPIAIAEISSSTGKGRHTTTVTRYYRLPGGGAVVDTPGLRELGLWGADRSHLDAAFPDIAALAQGCRFDDCRHVQEPGCAVRNDPSLPAERLPSFRKLSEEIDQRLRPGFGRPGGPTTRD
jgi:ribosome biogenesis GTPase